MKRAILIPICLFLLFSSCKKWQHKYPEDAERSKQTPLERLSDKWWALKTASINGIDYTDTVKNQFGKYEIYFSQNEFSPGSFSSKRYYGKIKTDIESEFIHIWHFKDNETILSSARLVGDFPFYSFMPCYLDYDVYNSGSTVILKLSASELKLVKTNINQDTTIIYYFTPL